MKRHLLTAGTAALLIAGLAGCSSGGGVLTDAGAVSASGAKGCVKQEGKILVRAEFECAGGLTLDTYESGDQLRAAHKIGDAMGTAKAFGITVKAVRSGENWELEKIDDGTTTDTAEPTATPTVAGFDHDACLNAAGILAKTKGVVDTLGDDCKGATTVQIAQVKAEASNQIRCSLENGGLCPS